MEIKEYNGKDMTLFGVLNQNKSIQYLFESSQNNHFCSVLYLYSVLGRKKKAFVIPSLVKFS